MHIKHCISVQAEKVAESDNLHNNGLSVHFTRVGGGGGGSNQLSSNEMNM